MLPRRSARPADHWAIHDVPHSQGLRCGKLFFVSGQVDLDHKAKVTRPGDMAAQTRIAMDYFGRVLAAGGLDASDLVRLTAFYASDGTRDEDALAAALAARLGAIEGPGPVLTLVPVEALAFPGMLIEIEGIAMRGENGERLSRTAAWDPALPALPPPFVHALKVGEMIFTSGITARGRNGEIAAEGSLSGQSRVVLGRLDGLLRQLGADLQDAVKTMLYNVEPGTYEDWREPALVRAAHYREPGPAATGISLPRLWPKGVMIKNDIIAMRGLDGSRLGRNHVWPEGHWDWPVHLPYRHGIRCGDLVFLGGQVPLAPDASVTHRGDLGAQTGDAMDYIGRVLSGFGLDFRHVVKVNAFYVGGADLDTLSVNALKRFSYFSAPGPTSTGVPVPWLAYPEMGIEIDIVAMV